MIPIHHLLAFTNGTNDLISRRDQRQQQGTLPHTLPVGQRKHKREHWHQWQAS
jgi:hypothetical protein